VNGHGDTVVGELELNTAKAALIWRSGTQIGDYES